jgi:hypothetical protein
MCKEMPVIPVDRVEVKKRIIIKNGGPRRHCHVTEKSEAIANARSCRSSRLTRWWTRKRIIGKN